MASGAGDAIVEAHAAGDEQIGFLNGVVDPRLAVHAHHAHVERVRGGKRAEAEEREGHGNLRALGEGADLLHGAGLGDAVAGEDDGALGVADQFGGLGQAGVFNAQHGVRAIGLRLGGFKVEDRGGLLRVFGDVDEDRAGAAGLCDLEGEAQRAGQVFSAVDEEVVLGHGQCDAGDVHFLKGVGAEHFAGDVAGDADDGNGIEHGGGDAGDEVGCAGAAGGDADADLAGGARVAVGHVRGALLVAHQDVVDGKLAQRVVGGQNCAAGIAEDVGNALAYQRGPQNFSAGEAGGRGEVSV